MPSRPINLIFIDDCQIILDSAVQVLADGSSIQLIATARSLEEARHVFATVRADVAVVDLALADADGFEVAAVAAKLQPGLKIIYCSGFYTRAYVERARETGAAAWVIKDSMTELLEVVRRVAEGAPFIGPDPARHAMHLPSVSAPFIPSTGKASLTPREIEILRLSVNNLEVKEIAARLNISPRTVEVHRQSIFKKAHTRSLADLTKYAIAHGLTDL